MENSELTAGLQEILSFNGEKFIEAVYRNVLRREPDVQGFNDNLNLLFKGFSKEFILCMIATSPEAKRKKVKIFGRYKEPTMNYLGYAGLGYKLK